MFIFVSIIAILIWAAFWGAIRLERTMGETRLWDRDTAAPGQQVMEKPEHIRAVPLVVFVDDTHLLDDGSATLVHQLAMTGAATVLLAVQSGERAPDPVVSLWKDGLAERIEVGTLGDAAVEELLATVLGGPVDAVASRRGRPPPGSARPGRARACGIGRGRGRRRGAGPGGPGSL